MYDVEINNCPYVSLYCDVVYASVVVAGHAVPAADAVRRADRGDSRLRDAILRAATTPRPTATARPATATARSTTTTTAARPATTARAAAGAAAAAAGSGGAGAVRAV